MDHSIGTLSNCSAVANSVNRFRRSCLAAPRGGGAAVDVGPDLLGVGARAVVLAQSAQFPRWELSNSPRTFGSRYQQKYQQSGPLQWAFACIFNASRQLSREIRNRTSGLSYCYYCDLFRGVAFRTKTRSRILLKYRNNFWPLSPEGFPASRNASRGWLCELPCSWKSPCSARAKPFQF